MIFSPIMMMMDRRWYGMVLTKKYQVAQRLQNGGICGQSSAWKNELTQTPSESSVSSQMKSRVQLLSQRDNTIRTRIYNYNTHIVETLSTFSYTPSVDLF
jgi:hypothetical protein